MSQELTGYELARNKFQGVLSGRPSSAICLVGPTGIGKTYVASRLLQNTPCPHLAVGAATTASELASALPVAKNLAKWATEKLQTIRAGNLAGKEASDALAAALAKLAPFILFVDDLHGPEVNLEFWQALAKSLKGSRGVALLFSSRTVQTTKCETNFIEPLNQEQTTQMLNAELNAALPNSTLPSDASAWIYQRSKGNPLFTLEHFRMSLRRAFLWNDGKIWQWRNPPNNLVPVLLEALIEQEFGALPDHAQGALQALAVIDKFETIDLQLWSVVAQLKGKKFLETKNLLKTEQHISAKGFHHSLYREVVLNSLSEKKQQLQQLAFDALKNNPEKAMLFLNASTPNEAALHVLEKVKHMAEKQNNHTLLAEAYALATQYTTGDTCGQYAFLAAQHMRRIHLGKALTLAQLATQHLPDHPEATLLLAELLTEQGRVKEAEQVIKTLSPAAKKNIYWPERLLCLRFMARDFGQVLKIWNGHPELHQQTHPDVATAVGWAMLHAQDVVTANKLCQAIEREGLNKEQLADIKQLQGAISLYAGQAANSEQESKEAIILYQQTGAKEKETYTLKNRANALKLLGRYLDAQNDLTTALDLSNGRGDGVEAAKVMVSLAGLETELGEFLISENYLNLAQEILETLEPSPFTQQCFEEFCWLYRAWNPPYGPTLAFGFAGRALKIAKQLQHPRALAQALCLHGDAAMMLGETQLGLLELQQALEIAETLDEPERLCVIARLYGDGLVRVGNFDEAKNMYGFSVRVATEAGFEIEHRRAALSLAKLNDNHVALQEHLQWFAERKLFVPEKYKNPESKTANKTIGQNKQETLQNSNQNFLEVLGPMRFKTPQGNLEVRGIKRQQLLARLLEARIAGRNGVSKLELFELLYPDTKESKAASGLKELVHSIRENIDQHLIHTTQMGYMLGPVSTDAEMFLNKPDASLWRGQYLEGIESSEYTASEALYAALAKTTQHLLTEAPAQAVRVAQFLVNNDVYELSFLKLYLQALKNSNQLQALEREYQQAKNRFLEVGENLVELSVLLQSSP